MLCVSKRKVLLILAERGMSIGDLAERAGFKRNNLSLLLSRGSCLPPTAGRLATALGVSVRDVLEDE